MQQILVGKERFLQMIRNLVEMNGTQRFITGFITACHIFAIMSQINPFNALPYFF
jgi:hypothetical protein